MNGFRFCLHFVPVCPQTKCIRDLRHLSNMVDTILFEYGRLEFVLSGAMTIEKGRPFCFLRRSMDMGFP